MEKWISIIFKWTSLFPGSFLHHLNCIFKSGVKQITHCLSLSRSPLPTFLSLFAHTQRPLSHILSHTGWIILITPRCEQVISHNHLRKFFKGPLAEDVTRLVMHVGQILCVVYKGVHYTVCLRSSDPFYIASYYGSLLLGHIVWNGVTLFSEINYIYLI